MNLPVVGSSYARKVTVIHQIEMTSICSLRCVYCAHPKMRRGEPGYRATLHMSDEVFEATIEVIRRCVANGTQPKEVNCAGIGESLLHPKFVEWILRLRAVVGPHRDLVFPTNGLAFDDAMARALLPAYPKVHVSAHRPEKAGPAIQIAKRYGMLAGISTEPANAPTNWAGQVDWAQDCPAFECHWLKLGKVMILADGRYSACSMDAMGITSYGTVFDLLAGKGMTGTSPLCQKCHHVIDPKMAAPGFDQRNATHAPGRVEPVIPTPKSPVTSVIDTDATGALDE